MNSRFASHMLLIVCVTLLTNAGCASSAARSKEDAPTDSVAIKRVMDRFFDAARKQDWDAVADLMASDFEIYTDNAEAYNKEKYVKLLKQDDLVLTSMALRDLEVRVSPDGHMGWMKYRGHFETSSHGKPSVTETAETLIFDKYDPGQPNQRWLITRASASIKEVGPAAK